MQRGGGTRSNPHPHPGVSWNRTRGDKVTTSQPDQGNAPRMQLSSISPQHRDTPPAPRMHRLNSPEHAHTTLPVLQRLPSLPAHQTQAGPCQAVARHPPSAPAHSSSTCALGDQGVTGPEHPAEHPDSSVFQVQTGTVPPGCSGGKAPGAPQEGGTHRWTDSRTVQGCGHLPPPPGIS